MDRNTGLSLLFAEGERPAIRDVERVLASRAHAGQRATMCCRSDKGWLEVLASGLTFELAGLEPAEGLALPPMEHQFGMTVNPAQFHFEAVTITAGQHVAGGAAMVPLVRAMAAIGVGLAQALPVKAVCWHPAKSWMEPSYFVRVVSNWLSGGGFPALGFTAVASNDRGGVESMGLSFFAGQEVRVEALPGEPRGEMVNLAVKIIDHIVRDGPMTALREVEGPSGQAILVEPTHDGRHVQVWRSAG